MENCQTAHKRFCSACRMFKFVEGGVFSGRNKNHWRCYKCVEKVIKRNQRRLANG